MENYSYSSTPNSHTIASSSKMIHQYWNDDLQCGIEYHTSTSTQKQTYISLRIGRDLTIPLRPSTPLDKAITMLEDLYSKMYMQISKDITKKSNLHITNIEELDEFYTNKYAELEIYE